MKTRLLLTLVGLLWLSLAQAAAPKDSVGIVTRNGKPFIHHRVGAKETLYGLAKRYKIPVAQLLAANPTAEAGLQPNQDLYIPVEKPAEASATPPPAPAATPAAPAQAAAPKKPSQPIEVTQETAPVAAQAKPVSSAANAASSNPSSNEPVPQGLTQRVTDNRQIDTNDVDRPNRILVIPFDPYLYFSDADDEIAERSKIPRQQIRQFFRRRLNALVAPKGYETMHLLGTREPDSVRDLDRIYSSISYAYEPVRVNPFKPASVANAFDIKPAGWVDNTKKKMTNLLNTNDNKPKSSNEKLEGKYYNVRVKDPAFWDYFNTKYNVRYYVFINQFEVKTNYENCLDRARQDYERNFIAHFSIFDSKGRQIAGNRVKIYYHSNSNSILQIVNDNMQKMADAILSELP